MTSTYSKRITCAAYTYGLGPRAAGSAALSPAGILLLEWPRPWPSHIEKIPELEPVREAAKESQVKILLVHQKRGLHSKEPHSVILYRPQQLHDSSSQSLSHTPHRWTATERYCPREAIVDTACALLDGDCDASDAVTASGDPSTEVIDLLVCTHGSRDRCCGRDGSRLAVDLIQQHTSPNLRIWHASHLGGHRFAPTATLLPQGTSWAYVDVETILGIVEQRLDPHLVLPHFRGSVMWSHHAPQTVDIDGFVAFGWDWLDSPRTATQHDHNTWTISESNGARSISAQVETRAYLVPPCGSMPGTPYQSDEFLEYVSTPEESVFIHSDNGTHDVD